MADPAQELEALQRRVLELVEHYCTAVDCSENTDEEPLDVLERCLDRLTYAARHRLVR